MREGGVNRVLTGLAGLLLLALGGSVLAVGLGAPPPHWWIHSGAHDVLLSRAERTRWRSAGWWWPAVIAALAILVLLALAWFVSVLRPRRPAEILVGTGDGEGARLRGRALQSALTQDAARQPGVAHARIHLRGRRTAPTAAAGLRLEAGVAPATALHDFTARALAHARRSAGLASLPAEVRLGTARHRAGRVT
ncbi:alkaline shock response membrane anchor protein AmaP [Streptomyces sp. NPDC096012]|uniref:alkaline shock response membrane anchor protein AmaP n=1 Tax=Streptomyces sp. NPDC096012 TaxID=3155684 RepID=UPI00336A4B2F